MADYDVEAYRREQAIEEEGKAFAETFSSFVNGMDSRRRDKAVEFMCRDHRTLQQGMMRFFVSFCEVMAKQEHDMRNQGAVALAKEVVKLQTALPNI